MKTKINKKLSVLFVLLFCVVVYAATEISWDEADKYYGQTITITGKIVGTHNTGKVCFLNFHQNWKKYFTAVIFTSDFDKFPSNPESHYLNKEVKVTGFVKEYQGKPEIILKDPSQIVIVSESNIQTENSITALPSEQNQPIMEKDEPKNNTGVSNSNLENRIKMLEDEIKVLKERVNILETKMRKLERQSTSEPVSYKTPERTKASKTEEDKNTTGGGTTVYVTKSGTKYHTANCMYLRSSKIPMSLEDAKKAGYTPCSRCNPPE